MPVYRKRSLFIAAILFIELSAGIFIGLIFASTPRDDTILPGVFINGLDVGGHSKQEAGILLKRHVSGNSGKHITLQYDERKWTIPLSDFDIKFDIEATVEKAIKTGRDSGSLLPALEMLRTAHRQPNIPVIYSIDENKLKQALQDIASQIDCPETDARIVTEGGALRLINEIEGKKFEMELNQAKLKKAVAESQETPVLLEVIEIKPAIRTADLEGIKDRMGTGITFLPGWQQETARTAEIAVTSLNGRVIRPGGKFSFRNEIASGYEEKFNEEVCRAVSALYQAALYSGVVVTERESHKVLPAYSAPGQDAAIHEEDSDLIIHNTGGHPLYIQALIKKNNIVINIFGQKKGGQTIQLLTDRKTAPDGSTEVHLYRVFYQDGKKVKTELISQDLYKTN